MNQYVFLNLKSRDKLGAMPAAFLAGEKLCLQLRCTFETNVKKVVKPNRLIVYCRAKIRYCFVPYTHCNQVRIFFFVRKFPRAMGPWLTTVEK